MALWATGSKKILMGQVLQNFAWTNGFCTATGNILKRKRKIFHVHWIYQWLKSFCTPLPSSRFLIPNRDMVLSYVEKFLLL